MSGWCLTWCLVQCDLPCNLDGVPGVARRLTGLSFCIHGAGYHSGIIPGLSFILTTVDWALCLTACLGGSHLKPLGGTLYGRDLPKQSRVFNSGIKRSEVLPLSTTAAHGTSDTDCHPSLMSRLHCSKSSLGNFGASMSTFIFHFTFHTEEAERSQLFLFSISYIAS